MGSALFWDFVDAAGIRNGDALARRVVFVGVQGAIDALVPRDGSARPVDAMPECCAPPWGLAWLEGRMPSGGRVGYLVAACSAQNEDLISSVSDQHRRVGGGESGMYLLKMWCAASRNSRTASRIAQWLRFDASGRSALPDLRRSDGSLLAYALPATDETAEVLKRTSIPPYGRPGAQIIAADRFLVQAAFAMCHCRNVRVSGDNGEHARASNKDNVRDPRNRGIQWKVLRIPSRASGGHGGQAPEAVKRALHICRGHFATYTEERPLFGKHVGRFWHPQHIRGTAEAGEVRKGYSVAPAAPGGV